MLAQLFCALTFGHDASPYDTSRPAQSADGSNVEFPYMHNLAAAVSPE
jgi:hypothetical protein